MNYEVLNPFFLRGLRPLAYLKLVGLTTRLGVVLERYFTPTSRELTADSSRR